MKRLLPMLMIVVLIFAACGTSPETPQPLGSDGPTATELPGTPVGTPTEPDSDPVTSPPEPATGRGEDETGGDEDALPPVGEATSVDVPDPRTTATPNVESPSPTSTPTPAKEDPDPVAYPTLPDVPEITSCAHAADLAIERIQIWLDALALVSEDAFWGEDNMPDGFAQFSEQMDAQMSGIETQAASLGCEDEEFEAMIFERIGQLEATNPNAEVVLEALLAMAPEGDSEPTVVVEPTAFAIESCDDAADIFIERLQVLVLDAVAGMTVEELNGMEAPPDSLLQFVKEMKDLQVQFQSLGCSDEEVAQLVGERLDRLVIDSEAAQEFFTSLEEAIAEGNLFDDLD